MNGEDKTGGGLYPSHDQKPIAYGSTHWDGTLKADVATVSESAGLTAEESAEWKRVAVEFLDEIRVGTADEGAKLHGIIAAAVKNPPTEAQRAEWRATTKRELRFGFGEHELGDRQPKVDAYLAQRPFLRDLLQSFGLDHHPHIAGELLRRAHHLEQATKGV